MTRAASHFLHRTDGRGTPEFLEEVGTWRRCPRPRRPHLWMVQGRVWGSPFVRIDWGTLQKMVKGEVLRSRLSEISGVDRP